MQPLSLLICLGVLWALLHLWLVPLLKERWKADDLKAKMTRAGTLVVMERLRDLAGAGACAVLAVIVLVIVANALGSADAVWPKAAISAAGSAYGTAKALSAGYGSTLMVLGLIGAIIVLWFAARQARDRVGEVWADKAKAMFEAVRSDPSVLEEARRDPELKTILAQLDAALAVILEQDDARKPDKQDLGQAHADLNNALSHLAIEMARKQIDFPDAAGRPGAYEATEQRTGWRRLLGMLSSKKLGEDLGLVRKPVGWVVTGLLFVSLTGWAAEPLANSLQLAVNNLRVQLMEAQAQQELDQALSRDDEPAATDDSEPAAADASSAARMLSQAFVREMASTPLSPTDGGGMGGRRYARAEVVRAILSEHQLKSAPGADPVMHARAEAAQAAATPDAPSAAVRHAEQTLEGTLREMQQRQPGRFATLMQQVEARYSAPLSPLDAQGKLTAKLLDEAFGTVDMNPEGELAKQAQKLTKDFGKEAVRSWANGALKQFLADTLAGVARPEVQRGFAFEMSEQSRDFLNSLRAAEGRGWSAGDAASSESQMAAKVANLVAELNPERQREMLLDRFSGYEQLFPKHDPTPPPASMPDGPQAPSGGGGGGPNTDSGGRHHAQARSTNFRMAMRSARVRGVLVGQAMEGEILDATDLRWQIQPPVRPGAPTPVVLQLRVAAKPGGKPVWQAIGSFDAGVLNQGLRYAADERVVATTITGGDGKVVRRLTYLHPVLVDTPLGCRVVEADRLVDTFTFSRGQSLDSSVAELSNDRKQMLHWLGLLELAEAVASQPASLCPVEQVQEEAISRKLVLPLKFSPRMTQAMGRFFAEQKFPRDGTDLITKAQVCAGAATSEVGKCLCSQVAPSGLPKKYWFPEDHTSQVREKKARLDASLAWLKPSLDRLEHLDFWTHTTFSLRDGRTSASNEDQTAALDFPPEQLTVLRRLIASNLATYSQMRLRTTTADFMGPLEEFVLAQRLARAALTGQLGEDFPLSRLIDLEKQTRRFVPIQPTIRWEPMESAMALMLTLQRADPTARDRFQAHQSDHAQRAVLGASVCAQASN